MIKFVLLVLLLTITYCKSVCDASQGEKLRDTGLSPSKRDQLVEEHNTHRNSVALGKVKNWGGKAEQGSMMYYLRYDNILAQKAQECADSCPKSMADCKIPLTDGFVFYIGDTFNGGADWDVKRVFRAMLRDQPSARQIEHGEDTLFGCGRSQVDRKSILSEVVVCYYNRRVKVHGVAYKHGLPGNGCPHGVKHGYLGLCKHSRVDSALHHQFKPPRSRKHQQ